MFSLLKKEGPPIVVEFYVGGRLYAQPLGDDPSYRDILLLKLLTKALKNGTIPGDIEPGLYDWNFVKVGLFHSEAQLTKRAP